ncbi:MAG: UDP-N-acetylmuramoyl-tripeptide--D-alanyl-D-alanine ligase [Polyangiales bacterium]
MATPLPRIVARFTLREVALATGGTALGDPERAIVGVSTDSRAIEAGAIFVALRGERFDGHLHVTTAAAQGAAAALIERDEGLPPGLPRVLVRDTTRALADLAAYHLERRRARSPLPTVAVSGAVGKTTTKELLAAGLTAVFGECLAPRGNLNNLVGAPVTALTLSDEHRAAVIECGSNAPGEIARIGAMARPDVAVCMNADIAHTEGVGSMEAVADEEGAIFGCASRAVVGNADDALSRSRMALAGDGVARWTFGAAPGAHARLTAREVLADGRARLTIALDPALCVGGPVLSLDTALLGPAVATNFAAALAALAALGVGAEGLARAARAMGEVPPVSGRLVPREVRGALVLDDTYNASPRAVRAALDAAVEVARARGARLLVALGDMLELGALSEGAHAEAVAEVARARPAVFVACGPEFGRAAAVGVPGAEVIRVRESDAAGEALRVRVSPGDVVLVKGSRGTRMERAIRALEG